MKFDWLGDTPLHLAACGHAATVEILIKHGSNTHEKNKKGKNMIYLDIFIN